MNWKKIEIVTTDEFTDLFSFILYDNGATGLEIIDPKDIDIIKNDKESWSVFDKEDFIDDGKIRIRAYFEESIAEDTISKIKQDVEENPNIKNNSYELIFDIVNEDDWANNWKQFYKPLNVGKKLLISPEWENPENKDGRQMIKINPGMAFGTGTHETTKLCLEAIENYLEKDMTVFDIGTGSGILSIASIKLGAANVVAVDIDNVAIKMANENFQLNEVSDKVNLIEGNLLDCVDGKADFIVSNIIAEIIYTMIGDLKMRLNNNGYFITSGIINEKKDMIENELKKNDFKILEIKTEGGWSLIVAKLKNV